MMRKIVGCLLVAFLLSAGISAQTNVPAVIVLTTGETLDVYHFGQLTCSVNKYFDSYIILKGRYLDHPTEIKDYSEINKLVLSGFKADPVASVGNEKGNIIVYKKNGKTVELTEAELYMACIGPIEKYNQIRVQMINPLTDKPFEKAIPVKDIQSITFM